MKFISRRGVPLLALFMATVSLTARSQDWVQIPTTQTFHEAPLVLNAWMSAGSDALTSLHPTVILAHGCGGTLNAKAQVALRMVEYAKLLNTEGYNTLVLDSFTTRGVKEICTQTYSKRTITPELRALDVLAAHQWLIEQPGVDPKRIAYLGWSNGGSTVLAATNLNNPFVQTSALKPVGAAVFYPGCVEDRRKGYRPSTPVLVQVGESDDWTHPGPCKAMVAESSDPKPEFIAYAGAYHQFDSDLEVKIRYDVGSGKGVHYGGQPEANAASKKRLLEFLKTSFGSERFKN
jgi:dienelactone hydrolase